MVSLTSRLKLRKPATTDLIDIGDLNQNFDTLDANPGTFICTSTTRPASPFTGQHIYETDTGLTLWWDGTVWVVAYGPGPWIEFNRAVGWTTANTYPATRVVGDLVLFRGSTLYRTASLALAENAGVSVGTISTTYAPAETRHLPISVRYGAGTGNLTSGYLSVGSDGNLSIVPGKAGTLTGGDAGNSVILPPAFWPKR